MSPHWPAIATDPLTWICLWVVVAGILSSLPSERRHWPLAYALIAVGLPLLAWAFAVSVPSGLIGLAVGAIVLRWPLVHLARRLSGRGRG